MKRKCGGECAGESMRGRESFCMFWECVCVCVFVCVCVCLYVGEVSIWVDEVCVWLFPKVKAAALLEHFLASRVLWR